MGKIDVTIAFADEARQQVVALQVPEGTTIDQAIALSDIAAHFPGLDFSTLRRGIWNTVKSGETKLVTGDRVEIYRDLKLDPKARRRQRAQQSDR